MLLRVVKRAQYSRDIASARLHYLSLHDPPFSRYDDKKLLKAMPNTPQSISKYIADLPMRYNAVWVEKIVAGLDTKLPALESQQILRAAILDLNERNWKHLRGVLTAAGKGKLTFGPLEVFQMITKCVEKSDVKEAIQWLILAQEQPGFVPTPETLRLLLAASAAGFDSWDCLYFVLGEMQRLAVPLGAADIGVVVRAALEVPHARWRAVRDLVFPSGQVTAGLSSETVLQALQVVADAQQHATVKSIFGELQQQEEEGEGRGVKTVFSDPSAVLGPLGSSALATQDFSFVQQVLLLGTSSSSPPCADPSSLHATSSPEAVVDAQVRWLETFVAGLWEKNAFEASAPVGLVVAWHLNNRNTDAATKVWNSHLAAVRRRQEDSVLDLQAEAAQALDATVAQLCSFSAKTTDSSQVLASQFLHSILFNDASGTAPPSPPAGQKQDQDLEQGLSDSLLAPVTGTPGVAGVTFAVSSVSAAQQMLGMLILTQDVEGASVVLSRALKEGHLVAQPIMTAVLELLHSRKDHKLVLELTELYLAAEKNDHRSPQRQRQRPDPKAAAKKVTGAGKFQDPLPRVPRVVAPFLFFPALQSLAQLGDFEGMLGLLTNTIPSFGYIPRVDFYHSAIKALSENGEHEKAVQLFAASQDLYKGLKAGSSGSSVRHNRSVNYGLYAPSLVLVALRACAEGKLAVEAMEIFANYEDARQKSVSGDVDLLDMQLLTELVTSADFVEIVPQFLRSLRGLRVPVVPSRHVLSVALAAAVSQQNAGVAKEVAAIVKQNHGCEVDQVVSLSDLLTSMREKFSPPEEDKVRLFLLEVDELKNIR